MYKFRGKNYKTLSGVKKATQQRRKELIENVIDYKRYLKKNPNSRPIFDKLIKDTYKDIDIYGQNIKKYDRDIEKEIKQQKERRKNKEFLSGFNIINEPTKKKREDRIINTYGSVKRYNKYKDKTYYFSFSLYVDKNRDKMRNIRKEMRIGQTIQDERDGKYFNMAIKGTVLDFNGLFVKGLKLRRNIIYRNDMNTYLFEKFMRYIKKDDDQTLKSYI